MFFCFGVLYVAPTQSFVPSGPQFTFECLKYVLRKYLAPCVSFEVFVPAEVK